MFVALSVRRWVQQTLVLGSLEVDCLVFNAVFCIALYDMASPLGLVRKHYMYYCKACNIKRAFYEREYQRKHYSRDLYSLSIIMV